MYARLPGRLEENADDSTQHIKGNYEQWHVHRKGLIHIINLRGGIGAFEKHDELRLTIMWYGEFHSLSSCLEKYVKSR